MMSSTEASNAQRMPAWKRLGLKLKQPTAAPEPTHDGTPAVGQPNGAQQPIYSTKRKLGTHSAPEASLDIKRPRTENRTEDRNAPFNPEPTSVSFVNPPANTGKRQPAIGETSNKLAQTKQHKKAKSPKKKQRPVAATDLKPALEYLRLWKTSRDSWKFNKNHQSALIKHVFDPDGIDAADIFLFYEYIRDLKGFVRSRLREAAMEIRAKDVADRSATFPKDTDDAGTKQVNYEELLTKLLESRSPSHKRKVFDEADYVATRQDVDVIIRRVVKRMRAEMILDELSDGEQTSDSRTTQSSTTIVASDTNSVTSPSGDKRLRLNDGIGRRRRKLRVNVDSSSSGSESESTSDGSSSDSSSNESDEDEDSHFQSNDGYETSSSSSSSGGGLDTSDDDDDGDISEDDDDNDDDDE